ncbi:MAG: hypothetical protein ABIR24_12215 [Verrucomicrobiota bacterium]
MRARAFLLVSLGLNLIFAAAWFFGFRDLSNVPNPPAVADIDLSRSNHTKTNVVVRRQNFTWEEVESDNYVTYIKNLRDIGCPDATIRDIIVADVDERFAHRRTTEIVSADHQWWTSEPDLDAIQNAAGKLKVLETERRALLTRLLGSGWETASNPLPPPTRTGVSLTGPILGDLDPQTKTAVYDIAANTQQKIEAYQEGQRKAGKEIDPAELAKLRQESRSELAKVLDPAQMEEFLLRYSNTAFQMRSELRGLEMTSEEFRALFHSRDSIEQQNEINYSGDDPVKLRRRQELETQRETVLEAALGKERYANYILSRDPIFRQSQATAEQLGAPAELVLPIYQINQLTEAERERIRKDSTLSAEEKIDALAAAQAEQQKSLEKILGPEFLQQSLPATNASP